MAQTILFDNIWRNSLIIATILAAASAAPYSKYGRNCGDIGCLPSESCVMQHDSCAYGQRENKDCGSYPACKKAGIPTNQGGSDFNIPNVVTRPTTTTTRRPAMPPTVPYYPPSGGGGGGGSRYPSNPGYDSNRGGYMPPGYDDYQGGGTPTRFTTKPPKSSGSSIFGNFQDILGDELGKYLKNQLINQITGGGGSGGTSTRYGSGGGGGSPLSGLFGSGGSSGGGSSLSSLFGSGGGGSGGSSLSSLFGSGGSGSSLSSLFGGGGGGGQATQSRGVFGLFNENPSAGKSGGGGTTPAN